MVNGPVSVYAEVPLNFGVSFSKTVSTLCCHHRSDLSNPYFQQRAEWILTSDLIMTVEVFAVCYHITSTYVVGYSLILLSTLSGFRGFSRMVEL